MKGNSIHALYLSYDGMTDPLGQSQVIPYLEGLSKKNIRFILISFEKKEAFERLEKKIRAQLSVSGIEWIPLTYTKNPPVLSTVFDSWRLKRRVRLLLAKEKIDVIHCRSYITALIGLWAKKKWNIRFIFDMRGLWADERVDGKLWNLKNPLYRLVYRYFKKKELEFLLQADASISLTHAAKEEILSWSPMKNKKIRIEVIPCCVDMDLFNPASITEATLRSRQTELEIHPGDFVLSYLGSLGTWYLPENMLLFFEKLHKKIPDSKFLLITRDDTSKIRQQAKLLGIDQSIRILPAERKDIPALLALSSIAVFFILPAYSKKASSPTKQGEIMAMGIPAVCNSGVGDTDRIIEKYNSGWVIQNWQMDDCIEKICNTDRTFSPQSIRAGGNEYFSLEKGIEKYDALYHSLLD